jgi:hypothetical protein
MKRVPRARYPYPAAFDLLLGVFLDLTGTTGSRCPRTSTLWAVWKRASPEGLALWEAEKAFH